MVLCAPAIYGGLEIAIGNVFGDIDLIFVADTDPDCEIILRHHYPDVPNLGDIAQIDWSSMKKVYRKLDEEQKAEAVQLYDAGFSLGDAASYFGVSRQSMWDLLRRRTTMRPQLRYGADNHFYRGGSTADDRAQNIMERAIEKGVLVPAEHCQNCGSPGTMYKDGRRGIQGHHPDYNKPLDVMWLCKSCHHEWHEEHQAITVRGGDDNGSQPGVEIDLLAAGFP